MYVRTHVCMHVCLYVSMYVTIRNEIVTSFLTNHRVKSRCMTSNFAFAISRDSRAV
jgi:hypothetical protein